MKTTALITVSALALCLAACGSGSKPSSPPPPGHGPPSKEPPHGGTLTFTAPTTTTIASPPSGATVRCTNHGVKAGAVVPAPGHGVSGIADGVSSSANIELMRKSDGSLVVSCRP